MRMTIEVRILNVSDRRRKHEMIQMIPDLHAGRKIEKKKKGRHVAGESVPLFSVCRINIK